MNSEFCCEEMKVFVDGVKQNEGGEIYKGENCPDELILYGSGTIMSANLIFRFCPYCGKLLDPSMPLVTKDKFVGQVAKVVLASELDCTSSGLRRPAALAEAVDKVRAIVRRAMASDGVIAKN
jgi:hypothetical protein